ncbi:MAG: Txe/YoeB family addiction module toxin [Spirochaetota bacterium]|nr:Txe/YoeB family addiction module toxin [Spirochaetota bacterium]
MVSWEIVFAKHAVKDAKRIKEAQLKKQVEVLLDILKANPFQNPPAYEKLLGDLRGAYSRRINYQHRLIYEVFEEKKIVRILRMWTHYE